MISYLCEALQTPVYARATCPHAGRFTCLKYHEPLTENNSGIRECCESCQEPFFVIAREDTLLEEVANCSIEHEASKRIQQKRRKREVKEDENDKDTTTC